MIRATTLKHNQGRQGFRPGACGTGISVRTGGKGDITVETRLMGDIGNGVEGD